MANPDREKRYSRSDLFRLFANKASDPLEKLSQGFIHTSEALKTASLTRRGLLVLGAGLGLTLTSLAETLNIAEANAVGVRVEDVPYEPGRGRQSFPWLPARDGFGDLSAFDEAFKNYSGYYLPEPVSDYLSRYSRQMMNSTPNGRFWVGECETASLAAGDCPYIEGGIDAFGAHPTWQQRMILAVLNYRYSKTVQRWGAPLSEDNINEIKDKYNSISANGGREVFIVNSASFRGYPGQSWYGYLDKFDGDGNMVIVDFLENSDLRAGVPMRKEFTMPADLASGVFLEDPTRPEPGYESAWDRTVNREVVNVILGKARIVSQ